MNPELLFFLLCTLPCRRVLIRTILLLHLLFFAVKIIFQVSMDVGDGGKTYYITGLWDPTIRDLLVLNTETPKGDWKNI